MHITQYFTTNTDAESFSEHLILVGFMVCRLKQRVKVYLRDDNYF